MTNTLKRRLIKRRLIRYLDEIHLNLFKIEEKNVSFSWKISCITIKREKFIVRIYLNDSLWSLKLWPLSSAVEPIDHYAWKKSTSNGIREKGIVSARGQQ